MPPAGAGGSGAPERRRNTLGRDERITRRGDFKRAYDRGLRSHTRLMTVILVRNGLPVSRLGVSATRKLGNAVTRNRAKRLVREVFRYQKPRAGLDVVVIPRREMLESRFSVLESDFRHAVERRLREI